MVDQYNCTLDPELHECPHLILKNLSCKKGGYCCFREKRGAGRPNREPKWFEKYYKNYR